MIAILHSRNKADISKEDFDGDWYRAQYPDVTILEMDPFEHYQSIGRLLGRAAREQPRKLKRIILVAIDLSTIGGISSRTRRTLKYSTVREVQYLGLTLRNERSADVDSTFCLASQPDQIQRMILGWSPKDTVVVVSNNSLKPFPPEVKNTLMGFPIVYISAGQMAFFVQDSMILADTRYVESFRAMKIVCFSDADINFQRQLGIHGQVKGYVPVEQRMSNSYDVRRNKFLGYVGRIDFKAKGCLRLLDVARALRGTTFLPLRIYTTDGSNSPEYVKFRRMIAESGLEGCFDFVVNCEDKDLIFGELAAMILPSIKESFGNSVVEAFSYGVPVIAASYAPGPAEIIENERSGILLDVFDGPSVRRALESLTADRLAEMSSLAFDRHKAFSPVKHLEFLEEVSAQALQEFRGRNVLPVFPKLAIAERNR